LNEALQLKTVRFIAESVEERARWYKALSTITNQNPDYQRHQSIQIQPPSEAFSRSKSMVEEHKNLD